MFYYIKAGRGFGPLPARELLELADQGTLKEDDPVRFEGAAGWRPAREVLDDIRQGRLPEPSSTRPKPSSLVPGSATVFTSAPPIPKNPVPQVTARRRCAHCSGESSMDARFCRHCGTLLPPLACARCGRTHGADARFCEACGAPLANA